MNQDETQQKNRKFFEERLDTYAKGHDNFEIVIRDRRIQIEDQRRNFYQFICLLILAVIGSTYFLQVSKSNRLYFSGIFLLILTVIFIILHLREKFDDEDLSLLRLNDQARDGWQQRLDLISSYIRAGKFSDTDRQKYLIDEKNIPFSKEVAKAEQEAKENIIHPNLEYSGELVIFLFLSGLFLILGSVIPTYFNWMLIAFGEILILIISCANTAKYISGLFSKLADFGIKKMFK